MICKIKNCGKQIDANNTTNKDLKWKEQIGLCEEHRLMWPISDKVPEKELVQLEVTATFSFSYEDLQKALIWARTHGYTYERDNEISDLLIAAALEKIIDPVVKNTSLENL